MGKAYLEAGTKSPLQSPKTTKTMFFEKKEVR